MLMGDAGSEQFVVLAPADEAHIIELSGDGHDGTFTASFPRERSDHCLLGAPVFKGHCVFGIVTAVLEVRSRAFGNWRFCFRVCSEVTPPYILFFS